MHGFGVCNQNLKFILFKNNFFRQGSELQPVRLCQEPPYRAEVLEKGFLEALGHVPRSLLLHMLKPLSSVPLRVLQLPPTRL